MDKPTYEELERQIRDYQILLDRISELCSKDGVSPVVQAIARIID